MWRWVMIVVLAVGVPLLSWRSARVAVEVGLGRRQLYLNAAVSLWILGALGFVSLSLDGVSLAEVGVGWPHEPLSFVVWSAGLTIAGLGVFVAAHRARRAGKLPPEEPLLLRMRPKGAGDALLVALVLSPSAGVCEEFLYRGLVFDTVRDAGGPAAAAAVSGILFAGAHVYQGWAGAARAGIIGLMLAASPWGTGSILPAITAHALVDALGLVLIWPWLDRKPAGVL